MTLLIGYHIAWAGRGQARRAAAPAATRRGAWGATGAGRGAEGGKTWWWTTLREVTFVFIDIHLGIHFDVHIRAHLGIHLDVHLGIDLDVHLDIHPDIGFNLYTACTCCTWDPG